MIYTFIWNLPFLFYYRLYPFCSTTSLNPPFLWYSLNEIKQENLNQTRRRIKPAVFDANIDIHFKNSNFGSDVS